MKLTLTANDGEVLSVVHILDGLDEARKAGLTGWESILLDDICLHKGTTPSCPFDDLAQDIIALHKQGRR